MPKRRLCNEDKNIEKRRQDKGESPTRKGGGTRDKM